MDTGWRRSVFTILLVAACLVTAAGPLAGAFPPDAPEKRLRIVATIQALDSETATIWLVTGTGFALRVVRAEVAPSCQIRVSGAAASLADLKPGQVVRTECVEGAGRLVALVIETIQIPTRTRLP